jgi:hypothetical protein
MLLWLKYQERISMKKILIFLVFVAALAILAGEDYQWLDNRYESGLNILRSDEYGMVLTHSVSSFSLEEFIIEGRVVKSPVFGGEFLPNDAGAPDLPSISRMIAIPEGSQVKAEIEFYNEEIIYDLDISPAFRIPKETEDGLEYTWGKPYETDALYPETILLVSEREEARGIDYVMLGLSPFRYHPTKRELHIYRDIKVTLSFEGGSGYFGEDRLRSRWWDPVLRSNIYNWEALPQIDYSQRVSGNRTPDYEYLIISPTGADFTSWADSIRVFRTQQGIRTGVVTLAETGSSNTQIENYINEAYNTWDIPPVAVLLLGDYGTNSGNTVTSPIYDNYCVSDNIFADISGNHLPDLTIARITARNSEELQLMVGKFLNYERNPPTNAGFYQNPVVAGGWQTERWFILCTEVVRGFFSNVLDKSPVREYAIYSGTPGTSWSTATNTSTVVNYFGANGLGYLGASPQVIPSWNGNANSINSDINNGCFMLQHRDHGGETGWGEPDYGNNNLGGLNNEDLTFVFSTNCLTGKFNWSGESFAEAFHRHAQGALGIIAASEVSYSFVNDAYVWGTYDYMWPNFDPGYGGDADINVMPAFANSSGKWYLQASNWPYNTGDKQVTYYLFHHHGDAFSTVYTQMPQQIALSYPEVILSGETSITITADAGSFICLSKGDEILAVAQANGIPQNLMIESQPPLTNLHLTVTRQDHYRRDETIMVIPPEGAYAVINAVQISTLDDDIIEYGENVIMHAQIENYGNLAASNLEINLTCNDAYITLTEATANAALINAGENIMLDDAFSFSVSENIPDDHDFYIDVTIDSDQGSWDCTINLTGYAPVISLNSYSISGDDNNNGRLDPGEAASFNIEILNSGGGDLFNAIATLTNDDAFCTITQQEMTIAEISGGESGIFTYRLEVSQAAPIGHVISFNFNCQADYDFSLQAALSLTVGLCLEDFESGGFAEYEWEMTGTGGWQISDDSYEGDYAAKSVSINHNQSAGMQVELLVLGADDISFYYKVSSENNYDFLKFYIDGNLISQWSGSIDWSEFSYPVESGTHIFKWEYSKDYSVSSGSDCAWIDYIVFPPISIPQPAQMMLNNDEFIFNLLPQSSDSAELTITNIGGSDLNWSIAKNYPISRASGGPDNYGYQWLDNDEPAGPVYNWIDIAATGTPVQFTHNDQAIEPIPLDFVFNFYGVEYTEFIINPNGWIGFGEDNSGWSNTSIPGNNAPSPAIMGFWDDLYPAIGNNGEGYVYYQNFADHLVVMFDDVQHYPGNQNGNYTFEMIIHENGEIILQYAAMSGDTDSATIGIQNHNGSDALQIAYNQNYAGAGLAVRILQVVDWLDISPASGIIASGSNSSITLTASSMDLGMGDFLCNLMLNSNDPNQNLTEIPVQLLVGGDILYGDIDDNGAVEAYDAALVLQYFVGFNPAGAPLPWHIWQILRADVDGNGSVEAYDASLIQQFAVGIINSFPIEIPSRRSITKQKINSQTLKTAAE